MAVVGSGFWGCEDTSVAMQEILNFDEMKQCGGTICYSVTLIPDSPIHILVNDINVPIPVPLAFETNSEDQYIVSLKIVESGVHFTLSTKIR